MLVETRIVGDCKTNCYIVRQEDNRECVVIDPGADADSIIAYLTENVLCCKAIFLTHGHHDHGDAATAVVEATSAPVYICRRDVRPDGLSATSLRIYYWVPPEHLPLCYYDDGSVLSVAGMRFTVVSTPGHTPGSVCLTGSGVIFSGDTLFKNGCGRSDLKGGDREMLRSSLRKLCALPGDYRVYPGHGAATNLAAERQCNPFCLQAMSIGSPSESQK